MSSEESRMRNGQKYYAIDSENNIVFLGYFRNRREAIEYYCQEDECLIDLINRGEIRVEGGENFGRDM